MKYLSVSQTAQKWNIAPRRVQVLCNENRIEGAQKAGNSWIIPENAEKPLDARKSKNKGEDLINQNIYIERIWAMPNKNTFEIKPIKELILEEKTAGLWIDPFANRNKIADITNDLNTEFDTDYHIDALDFLKMFDDNSVDGILYDPPYSPRQVSECYNNVGLNVTWDTTKASFWGNHKREISRILKVGGKVITFGWNSGGIGNKYGFEIQRILMVPHGGWHNDTICTVEIKTKDVKLKSADSIISEKKKGKDVPVTDMDKYLISQFEKLPIDYWDFINEDTQEYTHGIHNYPAMMVSPISRNIIRIISKKRKIQSLLDPYCGSGTVLVEGMLAGIPNVSGNDINPLALFLTKVKTTPIDSIALQSQLSNFEDALNNKYDYMIPYIDYINVYMEDKMELDLTDKKGWASDASFYLSKFLSENNLTLSIPDFKNIGYWFKPSVILSLQIIKDAIDDVKDTNVKDFLFVAFSESIRLVSNRRNGEFKMFRMTPEKVRSFKPDVRKEFLSILHRNAEKMNDFFNAVSETQINSNITIYKNNTCELSDVADDCYDLVITSPPYGDSRTTVAYGEYSRLSLQWLHQNDMSEQEIMGIDKSLMGGNKYRNGFEYHLKSETLRKSLEKIKDVDIERAGDVFSFYNDLDRSIAAVAKKTKKDGYQFWVVGNRTVKGEVLQTDRIIAELAEQYGLVFVYSIGRNIPNKVMPSKNSPSNVAGEKSSTMTNEHIVVLRKV